MIGRVDTCTGGNVHELADHRMSDLVVAHRIAVIAQYGLGNMAAWAEIGVAAKITGSNNRGRMYLRIFRHDAALRPRISRDAMINQHKNFEVK